MNDASPSTAPPVHVRVAFGAESAVGASPARVGSLTGWRTGEIVLTPVVDASLGSWSARVRESLEVDGLHVARPVRSRDGRHVVGGWRADRIPAGRAEARADETIGWALRITEGLAEVERPRIVHTPSARPWSEPDLFSFAEAAAWSGSPETDLSPGMEDRGTPFATHRAAALMGADALIRRRRPVAAGSGLVHGDLARALLYPATGEPVLADIVPFTRPAAWSAALVAVDHLTWGTVDDGVLDRWDHLPDWPQLVLRAMVFRLAVHALHPASRAGAVDGLETAARQVETYCTRVGG